jgi:HK97 family phage portal protein
MLFRFFRRAVKAAPRRDLLAYATASSPGLEPSVALGSGAAYPHLAERCLRHNPVAFRCVTMIARAVAAVPLYLQTAKGQELTDHPASALLARPAPQVSQRAFLETLAIHLILDGNGFIDPLGPPGLPPQELHLLRPDRVSIRAGSQGLPIYRVTRGARTEELSPDPLDARLPLIHLRRGGIGADGAGGIGRGQGDGEAALAAIAAHDLAGQWNAALLENGARPSLALIYEPKDGSPASLSEEQFQRLKTELHTLHSGAAKAGSVMLLDGGLTAKELSLSPKDMDWLAGRRQAALDIATAFGVPAQLVGIPDAQTYANMEQARLSFWEDSVLPLARLIADGLTEHLLSRFEPGLRLSLDEDAIPALANQRLATFEKLNAATFLTDAEKRAAVGYGPVEQG